MDKEQSPVGLAKVMCLGRLLYASLSTSDTKFFSNPFNFGLFCFGHKFVLRNDISISLEVFSS